MKIYFRKLGADILKCLIATFTFLTGVSLIPVGVLYALAHPFLYRYTDLDVGDEPFMPLELAIFLPTVILVAKLEEYGLLDVGDE